MKTTESNLQASQSSDEINLLTVEHIKEILAHIEEIDNCLDEISGYKDQVKAILQPPTISKATMTETHFLNKWK